MPIYEYTCTECGQRVERLQRAWDATPVCAGCGATDMRRAIPLIAGLLGSDVPSSGGCGCGGACGCGARA